MGSIAKNAGQAELVDAGAVERLLISCIGVTPDARGGVIPQDTFEALGGFGCSVCADDHARVLAKTHTDAATMVQ